MFMIRLQQLKLNIDHTEADLRRKLLKTLRVKEDALLSYQIEKQSLDARKKPRLSYVYTVAVHLKNEKEFLKKNRNANIQAASENRYHMDVSGTEALWERPVIVGSGPAGLFCAYMLAKAGYRPLLLERGMPVEQRKKDVEKFWETQSLDPESNVQFGEGGAGTFSDGKLNTLVKDKDGRGRKVLEIFVKNGAPKDILYVSKPHIGTDLLMSIVANMRKEILASGGEVLFHTRMDRILQNENGTLQELLVTDTVTGRSRHIKADICVLAIGHSARDTFVMLDEEQVKMEAKSFAVGVRIEHPQKMIDLSQYGDTSLPLPAAAYKLTASSADGRGVYTFCMCPGGYVVNASSEEGCLAVNGMSYHDRAGENANSAVVVTVSPEDFGGSGVLAGVAFQRRLEKAAFATGGGLVPIQLFQDFCQGKITENLGEITPQIKGGYAFGNVRGIFPEEISRALEEGIKAFGRKLPGYDRKDAVLAGVESRTSSPVRILRGADMQGSIRGLYPCGEGAGYAGGITSAAMDGLKTAEAIARKYHPFDKETKD